MAGEPNDVAVDLAGPVAALIFKTINDPHSGRISLLRVVSGKLESDCTTWNVRARSEEHTSELQSRTNLVCRLLLEKKKIIKK
mgnify:CR=1 FL=1